jgi:hypothetical protein
MSKGRKPYKLKGETVTVEPKKEKREYSGVPTGTPAMVPAPASSPKPPVIPQKPEQTKQVIPTIKKLDYWMAVHDLPQGWRREIREILKSSL